MASSAANRGSFPEIERIQDPATKNSIRLLWDRNQLLNLLVRGPQIGVLSPDTKPTGLLSKDAGRLFFATDYNRLFIWSGSAWSDAPNTPPRFQVAFFLAQGPDPAAGWALCNGGTVLRSTTSGGTVAFTTPVIPPYNGQAAWCRV